MNTPPSLLEQHAAELGLTQEDSAPVVKTKAPVGRSDKLLLGGACCAIALATAVVNVWFVVPTLLITGFGCVALVHVINSTRTLSLGSVGASESEGDSDDWLREMSEARGKELDEWNRDVVSNPMFRSSLANINHDDHHRRH